MGAGTRGATYSPELSSQIPCDDPVALNRVTRGSFDVRINIFGEKQAFSSGNHI